ncbi:hypothetical protein HPB48_012617 [Haemaphysalis longicornis]|uniref:Citrate transporter-like domain-containing protein n=1 Tax=Haemaphysalis longicornis TaxID=44386 RepID=A0A9J6FZD2_HAELO|nr:hypothetical protein HPB48_012617 [Haemaphysalis longicornis]
MMSIAIETTNLHTRIALWVLQRFGDSLRNIMAGYTVATFVITLLLKNSATLDIMVPVVDAYGARDTLHLHARPVRAALRRAGQEEALRLM